MQSDSPSKHSPSMQSLLPVFSLLTTATLWGVVWYPLRIAESYGLHGLWTTLITYGVSMIIGCVLFWRQLSEFKREPLLLGIIAVANGWLNVAFILAVIDGNVVRVILLFYLSPIWTTLLGWLVLKEQFSRLSISTLVVAMTGALIMLWDPSLGVPWPQNYTDWLAITSGMAFSISNVAVRKLQGVSIRCKTFAAWFGVTIVAIVWIALADLPTPHVSTTVLLWTMIIGTTLITIMTITVQYGVTHMPVYRSAIILLFELVVAAVSSQWLSDEIVTAVEWFGGTLIMLAGYLSARAIMKQSLQEKQQTQTSVS